jgi:hypothetical protein
MEAENNACLIGELPDELLVAIVSRLTVERGYLPDTTAEEERRSNNAVTISSLHALTLCCRKFKAIATPFLYQCIIRTERFMAFLLPTLLQNPHLGRYIQYVEITTPKRSLMSDTAEMATWNLLEGFDQPTRDQYSAVMKGARWIVPEHEFVTDITVQAEQSSPTYNLSRISEPTLRKIQEMTRSTTQDSLVVLLALADNLQDVAIANNISKCKTIILALRHYHKPNIFRRLWICSEYYEGCRGYLLRHMCLDAEDPSGSLAHYLCSLIMPETMFYELGLCPAMEEVSFTIQDVSRGLIESHLRGCASLKVFSCQWQWTDKFSPGYSADLPSIHRSLSRFRSSLTRLTIDTTESAWRVDLDPFIPALGSLRGFNVLAYVDVDALVLWGQGDFWEQAPLSQLLPESLEHLILKTEWDEDIEDKLDQLSSECTTSLPNLKRVECTWRPAPGFIADLLIDAFHSAGVDLKLDVEELEASA